MNIRDLTPEWHDAWNQFCLDSPDGWHRHTTEWLEYTLAYKPELNSSSTSFLVTYQKEPIAICPLVLEDYDNHIEFSFGGGYGPSPAFWLNDEDQLSIDSLMSMVFKEIDRRADNLGVSRIRMSIPPLTRRTGPLSEYNYLTRYNFVDSSTITCIVDLELDLEVIKSNMSKGFRQSLESGLERYDGTVYDHTNVDARSFNNYKQLHIEDAGRQTRPDETFELMEDWITQDRAFLIGVYEGANPVGFAYFTVLNKRVYYASSCRDPDPHVYHGPIGHFAQWVAIEYMKDRGYIKYEVGDVDGPSTFPNPPTRKQIDIGRFKKAVGGGLQTHYRGCKYYNEDYLGQELMDELSSLKINLFDGASCHG